MKQQSTQHGNNHAKLVQQNKKLHGEIRILESKMSTVITTDILKVLEAQKVEASEKEKFSQIVIQENYIKKLKNKLKQLRAATTKSVAQGIRNEENQLVCMKRSYQKLLKQKATLSQRCQDKKVALEYNTPLNNFKSETEQELSKVRRENTEMASRITELERQIRKHHRYQQLSKTFKSQQIAVENPEYETAKLDHQKVNWEKKSKLIENKWKPQIEALDKQYFITKEEYERKQLAIIEMEKQLKKWQIRVSATRNQSDVLMDRERLSKVIAYSPTKLATQNETALPKQNRKKDSPSLIFESNKMKNKEGFTELIKQFKSTNLNISKEEQQLQQAEQQRQQFRRWEKNANQSRYATQSQKVHTSNQLQYNFTRMSQKNEFIASKNAFSELELKRQEPKKMKAMNNVAVGTSFYYNEDED